MYVSGPFSYIATMSSRVSTWRPSVYSLLILTVLILILLPAGGFATLEVRTAQNGSYDVLVQGQRWLRSAATFLHTQHTLWTTDHHTLIQCDGHSHAEGTDALGRWNMIGYGYRINTSQSCIMNVSIKSYTAGNIVIFSQSFARGLYNTSTGDMDAVTTSFPAFQVEGPGHLGLLAFNGLFGYQKLSVQRFTRNLNLTGGMEGGPLVLFDRSGPTVVMSSFSEFMASSTWYNHTQSTLHWGVMGKVASIPAWFTTETILFYNPLGINKAVRGWGEALRSWYKKDAGRDYQDLTVTHLGYYTDNGAYYYHHLGYPFRNYEQMLMGITKDARRKNIPYKYLQYDDWWYYIRGPGYGATVRWEPRPTIFPHGLKYLYNRTRLPVVAHNRFWSSKTPYAKQNGGKFNFITYQRLAIPMEQAFWEWLFTRARSWGMVTYEQDWLNYQTSRIPALHTDVRLASRWMVQMGKAASNQNLTVQYCMGLPRHFLQALQTPAVTQVRVSSDYHSIPDQWRVGLSSMLAVAVGVTPFKDNFWTRTSEPGNPYNKTESSPFLQAVVSLLTTGPVAPSDGYRMAHPRLIARLHRADGLLLKPGRAALAIDAQIHQMAFKDGSGPMGEVWTTPTTISGLTFGIILAAALSAPYKLGPTQAGLPNTGSEMVAFPFSKGGFPRVAVWNDAQPIGLVHCLTTDPCLWYTAPIITIREQPVILLGELDKVVPISPQRIVNITVTVDDVRVTVSGAPGEKVPFSVVTATGPSTITCIALGPHGQGVISIREGRCLVKHG